MKIVQVILGAVGLVVLFLLTAIVFALLLAIPVWLLWNWVGVDVLALKHVTLLQAFGLSWLSALLFKSSSSKS
jgi:hypothetical protein